MKEMDELLEVSNTLMGEGGCPWDREQTLHTLKPYFIEEVHEVIEAIDSDENSAMIEELGDLLYVVIFAAKVAEKEGRFTIQDILNGEREKLVRRHPHVFGDIQVDSIEELERVWEGVKEKEKPERAKKSRLDSIPKTMPLVAKAQKMIRKIAKVEDFSLKEELDASEGFAKKFLTMLLEAEKEGVDLESSLQSSLGKIEKKFRKFESR